MRIIKDAHPSARQSSGMRILLLGINLGKDD
jgi:hypothetical protein